jgi:hypothetical protein
MNILMVMTSHDKLGNTGRATGVWLEEFAAPYYVFKDAGLDITLASPRGGHPPIDPKSELSGTQTAATRRLYSDKQAHAWLAATVKLRGALDEDLDAVFYPGGHGPLWDFAENPVSINFIETMYDRLPPCVTGRPPFAMRAARKARSRRCGPARSISTGQRSTIACGWRKKSAGAVMRPTPPTPPPDQRARPGYDGAAARIFAIAVRLHPRMHHRAKGHQFSQEPGNRKLNSFAILTSVNAPEGSSGQRTRLPRATWSVP